jgi:hypothetical protein
MKRVLLALFAVLFSWLGLAAPVAVEAATPSSAVTYAYDGLHDPAAPLCTTFDRCPPTPSGHAITYNPGGLRSQGPLMRPHTPIPPPAYGYDDTAGFAQTAHCGQSVEDRSGGPLSENAVVKRSDVAANGGTKAITWAGRDPAYRSNLTKFLGKPPPGEYDAHHVLPVVFGRDIARLGIDANDPQFGAWVPRTEHQGFSSEYSKDWAAFLRGSPSSDDVFEFGCMMGGKYGFDVNY